MTSLVKHFKFIFYYKKVWKTRSDSEVNNVLQSLLKLVIFDEIWNFWW